MVFLPGIIYPNFDICALCDERALYTTVVRIKISDQFTAKLISQEIEMMLCEQHANKMEIQIDKFSRMQRKLILP